jgi:hypothetical protein
MTGDVTLTKGAITVVVTAEDQHYDHEAIDYYLESGYQITKDERVEVEE